jgi:hypothetical protein
VQDLSRAFEGPLQRAGIAQISDCDFRRARLQQVRSGLWPP